jgi:glutaminase
MDSYKFQSCCSDFWTNILEPKYNKIFYKYLASVGLLHLFPEICDTQYELSEFVQTMTNLVEKRNLLVKIFTNKLVIQNFVEYSDNLSRIFNRIKEMPLKGSPANYIPQLANADPNLFGMSFCSIDGQMFSIGDTISKFSIQSCVKPLLYCLALEEHPEDLHRFIGREPSGVKFNSLSLNDRGQPHNPMINAGAIMTCSLIKSELLPYERFDYISKRLREFSGGIEFGFNNSVYLSEKSTADTNFALAYIMRGAHGFPEKTDINEVLDLYFQCCSMDVTTEMLSTAGATLANKGQSVTLSSQQFGIGEYMGNQVISNKTSRNCLSLMYSCGMYDYSGVWAFDIGIPAKSGVSGCIYAVIPNIGCISIYSPNIDSTGNSIKGIEFFRELVTEFDYHTFN